MIRLLNVLLFMLNIVMLIGATYFVVSRGFAGGAGWTPAELVTIVLTALATLITVLGIFIAVLAVWGYARLSEEAQSVARKAAVETAVSAVPQAVAAEIERRYGNPGYGAAAAAEGNDAGTDS